MRLGLIARADNSGLGMQTWEFFKHMNPAKTMVVDISKFNNNKTYPERYSGPQVYHIKGFPTNAQVDTFLDGLDVVFIAEAAYNPYLYEKAREMGVKTAVQYNYEFMDWLVNPLYPKPDMLIAPSKWHFDEVQKWCEGNGVKHVYLHCPVNTNLLNISQEEATNKKAQTFLHVAGRSAAMDRNGTETVIAASRYLKTNAQILIHFQGEQGLPHQATHSIEYYCKLLETHGNDNKVTIQTIDYPNYQDVYQDGDVMILPRRYGGNCLPMNEALACGMPVIMPNISPNNEFLPNEWLTETTPGSVSFTPRTTVEVTKPSPIDLAKKIDEFYNLTQGEFFMEIVKAQNLAYLISWEQMKPKYIEVFESLL